jgi:hypothetical protein
MSHHDALQGTCTLPLFMLARPSAKSATYVACLGMLQATAGLRCRGLMCTYVGILMQLLASPARTMLVHRSEL